MMRKVHCFIFAAVAMSLLAPPVIAADDSGLQAQGDSQSQLPNVVPPPPPEELTKGEKIEPGVTIVEREWAEFREFSAHGRVYAVKVIPHWGPPYWLYDSNGDGTLEMRGDFVNEIPSTVQW
ncbi:MAG: DUF2782 domain-containing protein, partial [Nitrococcus sp.]|nr:DUF2782 domain-containing protein [Nitrococcus sp.]